MDYKKIKDMYFYYKGYKHNQVKRFLTYCYSLGYRYINRDLFISLLENYDFDEVSDIETIYNRIIKVYSKPFEICDLLK